MKPKPTVTTILLIHYINKWAFFPVSHWWQNSGLNWVIRKYESVLNWSLGNPIKIMAFSAVVFVGGFVTFGAFPTAVEFFPEGIPPKQLYVQVEGPVGTNVEQTDEILKTIEGRLATMPNFEDVESIVATAGKKISGGMGGGGGQSTHL